MATFTTADRFKELGLEPPDLSFIQPKVNPGDRFGREPIYNTRVLIDNWYEDRRQYKLLCSRCVGPTIYTTDYQARCPDAKQFPPQVYQTKLDAEGEGSKLIRNTEDYCQYLQNYTTTYDLMHNWEVRRAGAKPKPRRRWGLIQGAVWHPQPDNSMSFGNLTQIGYRKSGQVPLLPNDWDLYANTGYITETKESYPKRNYPADYETCRKVTKREAVRELQDSTLIKKPLDPWDRCGDASLYYRRKVSPDPCCPNYECVDESGKLPFKLENRPRFGNLCPLGMTQPRPSKQTLHLPRQSFPYKSLKHVPQLPPEPCKITKWKGKKEVKDYCREYAGNTRFDYKGAFRNETTLS